MEAHGRLYRLADQQLGRLQEAIILNMAGGEA